MPGGDLLHLKLVTNALYYVRASVTILKLHRKTVPPLAGGLQGGEILMI